MAVAVVAAAIGCVRGVDNVAAPIIYAHYYGWYNSIKWEAEASTNDPSLGLYDSLDDSVVSQHIEWGKRAGITAFSVSWHGRGSNTDAQLKTSLKPAIEAQTFGESAIQFTVLFETPDILGVPHGKVIDFDGEFSPGLTRGGKFLQEMNYLADNYFGSPGYHKIDEQPVVFLYLLRDAINHQALLRHTEVEHASQGIRSVSRWGCDALARAHRRHHGPRQ